MNTIGKWLAVLFTLNNAFVSAVSAFDFTIDLSESGYFGGMEHNPEWAKTQNHGPIWTTGEADGNARLMALIDALDTASGHGLPFGEAEINLVYELLNLPRTPANVAKAESEISRIYLRFASSLNAGAIDPGSAAKQISRERKPPSIEVLLAGIVSQDPSTYIRSLAPATHQYQTMRKELKRLDWVMVNGGWGERVNAKQLRRGDSGAEVVKLRNRLIRMGYMSRTSVAEFTNNMWFAVKRFQSDHGLDPDGIADSITIDAINVEPETRRQQVIASLERERWLNKPLGEEYVRVNIANFHADVISKGEPIFSTRVVVGKSSDRLQTPEFSDLMTHFVINPTWFVPRSITVREILPELQKDPSAEPLLQMFSQDQGFIPRSQVNFARFDANNFPYDFRQPPGPRNALGQVKFMFPNLFNVYMHDTPHRSLFEQETRNFSHGCIRLHRAADFANFLLGRMVEDPQTLYNKILISGRESTMLLDKPLPVHITYRSAFVGEDNQVHYRKDIYGRDQAVYEQLANSLSATN